MLRYSRAFRNIDVKILSENLVFAQILSIIKTVYTHKFLYYILLKYFTAEKDEIKRNKAKSQGIF